MKFASVTFLRSSTVNPYNIYHRTIPYDVNLKTAFYVINVDTASDPVIGIVHYFIIFGYPFGELCSIATTTVEPHATKSIAPPTPFTFWPGII